MIGLDKHLAELMERLTLEGLASVIEAKVLNKLAELTTDDFSAFAKAFALSAAKGEAETFDLSSYPGAEGLMDRLELSDNDLAEITRQFDALHFDHVPQYVQAAIKGSSASILRQLNRRWKARDAEELQSLAAFRSRQDMLWGKAFSNLRMLLLCCREIGTERLEKLKGRSGDNQLDWALQRLHARGCLIGSEVSAMVESGHAHGAMARWRTLYEIEVVALTLLRGGEAIAERFRDHAAITAEKDAASYDEQVAALRMRPLAKRKRAQVARRCQTMTLRYGADFKNDYGWAVPLFNKRAPNLRDLATLVDRVRMWPFQKLASTYVHGGTKALLFNIGLLGEQDILLAGASNAGHADPLQLTADSLATITGLLFHRETTSADTGVVTSTIRMLADQTIKQAMQAHRRQLRFYRAERLRAQEGRDEEAKA